MMQRRNFLRHSMLAAVATTAGCSFSAAKSTAPSAKQPNVVLVITDDQGYGDLSCHGNPILKTPNIDKLFAQSTRMTNYHVAPTCAPTRAGLMTGRYCNATGVWHTIIGRSILRRDEKTMAHMFKENGYATGFFGKWHLGDNYPARPGDKGFTHVVRHGGGGIGQEPDYWGNDYNDDTYWVNEKPTKFKGYCTDIWFDETFKFMRKQVKAGNPFFAYLSTNCPHSPHIAPDKFIAPYKGKPGVPNAGFYGQIANIDWNMERLTKLIDSLGIADNTIYIFTTDNGTAAGVGYNRKTKKATGFAAGMRGKKGSEYEGGHRVPMFIRFPGKVPVGKDIDRLCGNVDMLPTLATLCGTKLPADHQPIDGKDLTPLILGETKIWPDRVLISDSQRMEMLTKWRKSAVMTQRWRLVNGVELYDMNVDPGQKTNVATKHPDTMKKLRGEYEAWWKTVSDRGDEFCRIGVGADESTEMLMSFDLHSEGGHKCPWNQRAVRAGQKALGFWEINVERAGTYEFKLRRWPNQGDVTNWPMDKKFFDVTSATLHLTEGKKAPKKFNKTLKEKNEYPYGKTLFKKTNPVSDPAAVDSTFTVKLPAGPARLETILADKTGKTKASAFYVLIRRIK
jgi:arylsulfatase A-like enzyme